MPTVAFLGRARSTVAAFLAGGLLLAGGCGDSGSDESSATATVSAAASNGPGGGGPGGGMGRSCTGSSATPVTATSGAVSAAGATSAVTAAVTKAEVFLATLSSEQKETALEAYSALGTKQCSWSNFPDGLFNGRIGVKLGDLNDAQKTAAYAALRSVLSTDGYTQVEKVIAGDEYLKTTGGAPGSPGEDNYHLVLFGEPSADRPWTLQFGGHHLAVHVSLGGGALSVSPHFSGIQPTSFESGGITVEGMKQETEDIFGLFRSLSSAQQAGAKTADSYDDIVMGPGTDTGYPDQEGLSYSELTDAQKNQVKAVIEGWVGDAAAAFSKPMMDLYHSQLDRTTIAYSGTVEKETTGAYFRIDGPRVWIEWINTDAAGFHYHTVYRDKLIDYGTGVS